LAWARSAAASPAYWPATSKKSAAAQGASRRAGREIVVTHAAARNLDTTTANTAGIKLTGEALEVVNDPDVSIIVELMGGYEPARGLVLRALANGKHVVTANKALIAKHGNEIFAAARTAGMMVGFEAAVAGGIPIIKAIREGLAGNHLEWVAGIINGTAQRYRQLHPDRDARQRA